MNDKVVLPVLLVITVLNNREMCNNLCWPNLVVPAVWLNTLVSMLSLEKVSVVRNITI